MEKLQTGKRHLIPRQLTGHGIRDSAITFMDEAVRKIIGDYTRKAFVHTHVPAGATPKDGASQWSQASLYSNRIVRSNAAMTGKVNLRGRVLPVGGIKMKIQAAHRAKLKTIILPKRNGKDLEDVSAEVRNTMDFVLVDRIDPNVAKVGGLQS